MKSTTNPTLLTPYGCEHLQIEAESQHFNLKVIVSFHFQCVGVRTQNNENILNLSDCTMHNLLPLC